MRGYLFPNKDMLYSEYLTTIKDASKLVGTIENNNAKEGLLSAADIMDLERRQRLIDVSIGIDREINEPMSKKPNIKNEFPRVMSAAILIGNHYASIKDLNDEQLVLLSHMAYNAKNEEMWKFLSIYADGTLLQAAIDKKWPFYDTSTLLEVVEYDYFGEDIDFKNIEQIRTKKQESLMFIKNSTKENVRAREAEMAIEMYDSLGQGSAK